MTPAAATRSPTCQRLTCGPTAVDDAGAIDAGNERQYGAARRFMAGAQAHVQDAIDRRGVHLDADFAFARRSVGNILETQNVGRPILMNDDGFHS